MLLKIGISYLIDKKHKNKFTGWICKNQVWEIGNKVTKKSISNLNAFIMFLFLSGFNNFNNKWIKNQMQFL